MKGKKRVIALFLSLNFCCVLKGWIEWNKILIYLELLQT